MKVTKLPVFCPSGAFSKRDDNSLLEFSGIVCLDIDHVQNKEKLYQNLKPKSYVLSIFDSPTDGIKVLCLVDKNFPLDRFKDLYKFLGSELGLIGRNDLKFDATCGHISRACFWTYSKNIYINPKATPIDINLNLLPLPVQNNNAGPQEDFSFVPVTLNDYRDIRKTIQDTHSRFEKYNSFYPGVRNNRLYMLACNFWADGIPEEYAKNYLVAYYANQTPGFTAAEIEKTVKSAYK